MDKLLTCIVPAHNVGKYLDDSVGKLVNSDIADNIEILIVCNSGSTDNTEKIAEEYQNMYPQIVRFLPKKDGGYGSTINYALPLATGKYIRVLDGDDWLDVDALKNTLITIKNCKSDLLVSNYCIVNEHERNISQIKFDNVKYGYEYKIDEICSKIKPIEMHALMYNREFLIKNYRQLDEKCFYVDVEYILFPLPEADTIYFDNNYLYMYRLGRTEQSVNIANKIKNREMTKRVVFSLIHFYNDIDWSLNIGSYVAARIDKMITSLFSVYLKMPADSMGGVELKQFDKELKKASLFFYRRTQFRIKLLRLTGYNGYTILSKTIKTKKHIH